MALPRVRHGRRGRSRLNYKFLCSQALRLRSLILLALVGGVIVICLSISLLLPAKPQPALIIDPDADLEWNPRLFESPNQKWDDLSLGKSCQWVSFTQEELKVRQRKRKKGEEPPAWGEEGSWQCQDCGETKSKSNGSTCHVLPRNHICDPMQSRSDWNNPQLLLHKSPPRRRTYVRRQARYYNPTNWVVTHFDHSSKYESAPCTANLELPCFDLSKCPRDPNQPIKVYLHNNHNNKTNTDPEMLQAIQRAEQLEPTVVQFTPHHQDACLYIVTTNSFPTFRDMIHSPLYMAGQNHLAWDAGNMFGAHLDQPNPRNYNFELAALASEALHDGTVVRPGYDIVLPLNQIWMRPKQFDTLHIHRPRRLLLSFKAHIRNHFTVPYEHHRWLAVEYWSTNEVSSDVQVDTKCDGHDNYTLTTTASYGELLLNSTFVFCPGGGGPSSFRFTESLAADAIPVVVAYFVPPFYPEIDWSDCVVTISEARIPDIPRILRQMPDDEIRARRERCRTLYRGIFGRTRVAHKQNAWIAKPKTEHVFLTTMKIWRKRIQNAYQRRGVLGELEQSIQEAALADSNQS